MSGPLSAIEESTMRARRRTGMVAAAAGALAVGLAGACTAQGLLYVGGSVGATRLLYDPTAFGAGSSGTGYQVDVGTRPLPFLAAELDYLGLPRAFSGANFVDTSGAGLSALAILPIPVVDLFAKVGLLDWRTRVRAELVNFDRSGQNATYGVGAGAHWGNLGARVEFERFDIAHTRQAQLASVGLTWSLF